MASRLVRGWIARIGALSLLATALCAQAAAAPTIAVNLDHDKAPEHLVQVRVRLPYFPQPVFGVTWAVSDRVNGRKVTVKLGPPGERLRRPHIGNRNGDTLRDIFIEAQAGNSLFFGEIWQWDGRRAHLLFKQSPRALPVEQGGLVWNGPLTTRFPDDDGDGVSDVVQTFSLGECRACPPQQIRTVRYRCRPVLGRWPLLGLDPLAA